LFWFGATYITLLKIYFLGIALRQRGSVDTAELLPFHIFSTLVILAVPQNNRLSQYNFSSYQLLSRVQQCKSFLKGKISKKPQAI